MLDIEKFLQYSFKKKKNIEIALCHSSAGGKDFERMEFLGDRILSLTIASILYNKYKNENEGDLAKRHAFLVSGSAILSAMRDIDIFNIARFDKCVKKNNFNSIKIDICESIFASIFIDADSCFTTVFNVIERLWSPLMEVECTPPIDAKSMLQEYLQSIKRQLPQYTIFSCSGPSHSPIFTVHLTLIEDNMIFKASGHSKQQAEKNAAIEALKYFKNIN